MFVKLMKYCRGYVRIRLQGFSPERFMNLCCNHNILMWDVISYGDYYELSMSVEGFFSLKSIVKKTGTKVVIMEKHGLPFFLYHYRKRKIFFAGCFLCIAALYILSLFIWDIGIEGNYTRTTDIILHLLKESDISPGIQKKNVDCEEIERLLREEYEDVTWASARIEGTRLMIRIKENDVMLKVPEIANNEPTDLKSEKDGTVVSIVTRSGTPMIKAGDEVKAGDLLISGNIPVYNDAGEIASYQHARSDADIMLLTQYQYEDSFPLQYQEKEYTGNQHKRYGIKLFQTQISVWGIPVSFHTYDLVEDVYPAKLFQNFYLPLQWQKKIYKEYTVVEKQYEKKDAKALALQNFKKFCTDLEEKGVQIIENNVKIDVGTQKKNYATAKGTLIVIEKTGIEVPAEHMELLEEQGQTEETN